jgi:molecular chaperone DnaJ
VKIFIETPKNLTSEQKELLQKFKELTGKSNHPVMGAFLDKAKKFLNRK